MIQLEQTIGRLLPGLEQDMAAIANRVRASVVVVEAMGRGTGSGVIWDKAGLIVTNNHVVVGSRQVAVSLEDGRTARAEIISRDPAVDLAALRVRGFDLPAVEIRSSDELSVGELVLAVGNPLGERGIVTLGIVSGVGSQMRFPAYSAVDVVQADIELLPGNSGGPLVDASGRVVGINNMIVSPGVALAVPTNVVTQFLGQHRRQPVILGVAATPVTLPSERENGNIALVILAVEEGSVAERAGVMVGDVVTAIDNRRLQEPGDLAAILFSRTACRTLSVLRGGRPIEISVSMVERKA